MPSPVSPISLSGCCPSGWTYIDENGYFFNYQVATFTVISNDIVTWPLIIGKCSQITNFDYAINWGTVEPIPCPCCPFGYVYSDTINACVRDDDPKTITDTVPCINCVCPPADSFVCPTCETQGQAIAFNFDFTTKQCESCTIQDDNGPSCIVSFVPPQYVDPIINFKLRNKNFI